MHVIGDILAGRYRVDAVLGSGGMGGVYQATQITLDKPFAIKEMQVVIPNPKIRDAAVAQFKVEAQILHSLVHPGLPHLYDFFESDGKNYLVMELIRGSTLESIVSRNPVSEVQLLRWAREICAVLHYLHTHDPPVIFRDLKPSNIMLTSEGHIKLIDFGIAKVWDAPDVETLTRTGIRGLCTPGFAAPEQYGSGTDVRTDIYALGATLYSLFTQTVPPPSVDLSAGRARVAPIHNFRPEVTAKTVEVIEWMMQLNMSDRPQTMVEVMEAFGFNPAQSPVDLNPQTGSQSWLGDSLTTLAASGSRTVQKRSVPRWVVVVGAAILAALAALALWTYLGPRQHAASPTAVTEVKVMVSAQPNETKLFDDGAFLGFVGSGATLVALRSGHHSLTFKHDGYAEHRQELDVGNRAPPLNITLEALPGTLRVSGPQKASISVDGEAAGVLPFEQDFEAGSKHVLTVSKAGYISASTTVVIPTGQPKELQVDLTPSPAPTPAPGRVSRPPPVRHVARVTRVHKSPSAPASRVVVKHFGPFTIRYKKH